MRKTKKVTVTNTAECIESPYSYVCCLLMQKRQELAENSARCIESGEESGNMQLQMLGERVRTLADLERDFRYKGWN